MTKDDSGRIHFAPYNKEAELLELLAKYPNEYNKYIRATTASGRSAYKNLYTAVHALPEISSELKAELLEPITSAARNGDDNAKQALKMGQDNIKRRLSDASSSERHSPLTEFAKTYFRLEKHIQDSPSQSIKIQRNLELLGVLASTLSNKKFKNDPEIENFILNKKIELDELVHEHYVAPALPEDYNPKKPSSWKENHIREKDISKIEEEKPQTLKKRKRPKENEIVKIFNAWKNEPYHEINDSEEFRTCKLDIEKSFSSIAHNKRSLYRALQTAEDYGFLEEIMISEIGPKKIWQKLKEYRSELDDLSDNVKAEIAKIEAKKIKVASLSSLSSKIDGYTTSIKKNKSERRLI